MKLVTEKELNHQKNKKPFSWSCFFDKFIPAFLSLILIVIIIYIGGLVGVLTALALTVIYHIYHRIIHGYWLDK